MEQGTRLQVSVLDARGALSVASEGVDYRGRLVDSVETLFHGQHIRIQIGLDPGPDQSLSFDPVMTLMGTVTPIDEDAPEEAAMTVGPGAEFAVEVLRLNRGLLWSAVTTEPEAGPSEGSADHSKSGVEVRVVEDTGQLELTGSNHAFTGWLVRVPLEFSVGQKLHLRAVVPTGTEGFENIDVLGRVVQILDGESRPGYAPVQPGVRFGFGIVQHSEGELPLPVVGKRWVDEFLIDSARVPAEVFLPPQHHEGHSVQLTDPSPTDPGLPPGDMPQGETTGIIGSLRQLSLISLLQSLELNRRTACVEISTQEAELGGTVNVQNGQVVAAQQGAVTGDEAFYGLALLDRGGFRVRFGAEPEQRNINTNTTELILEVLNRSEEAEDHGDGTGDSHVIVQQEEAPIEDTFIRPEHQPMAPTAGSPFYAVPTEEETLDPLGDSGAKVVATLMQADPPGVATDEMDASEVLAAAAGVLEEGDAHDTHVGSVDLPELPIADDPGGVFSDDEAVRPVASGDDDDPGDTVVGPIDPGDAVDDGVAAEVVDDEAVAVVLVASENAPSAQQVGKAAPHEEPTSQVFAGFFEEATGRKPRK